MWVAKLFVNGKCLNLGRYDKVEEAAAAYRAAALEHVGDYVRFQ